MSTLVADIYERVLFTVYPCKETMPRLSSALFLLALNGYLPHFALLLSGSFAEKVYCLEEEEGNCLYIDM